VRLGAENSGYYFFVVSFLLLLTSLSSLGLNNSVLKEVSISSGNFKRITDIFLKSIVLILFASLALMVFIYCYILIANKFNFSHYIIQSYYGTILLSLFPFTLMFFLASFFQAFNNKYLLWSMIMMNLGYQLIMIILIFLFDLNSLDSIFYSFNFSVFFIVFVSCVFCFKWIPISFSFNHLISFKSLLVLSYPMMLAHIVSQINNFSGQFLISLYSSSSDISFFSVLVRISILMGFIFTAIAKVVTPKFALLYKENKIKQLQSLVTFSNRILFFLSFCFFVFIFVFGKWLLSFFGQEFVDLNVALNIVIFGQFLACITGLSVFILQMTGGEKVVRNSIIISTIISLTVGLMLIPKNPIYGAVIMTTLNLILMNVVCCYKVYTRTNIKAFSLI